MVGAAADAAAKVPSLKMEDGTGRWGIATQGRKVTKKSKNNRHSQKSSAFWIAVVDLFCS